MVLNRFKCFYRFFIHDVASKLVNWPYKPGINDSHAALPSKSFRLIHKRVLATSEL